MKTLIIGASGLVGNNCYSYLSEKGWDCIGTYFSFAAKNTVFLDTLNKNNPDNFDIMAFQPEVIIHCGALTHVDLCEKEIESSYLQTVVSTQHVIEWAKACKSVLVLISTDYIFDGINGPYDEEAQANPISVYGKHKWEAEQAVANSGLTHLILRVTNIYGNEERGKNFVARIFDQANQRQHLKLMLPKDQYATPVNAADIARAIYLLLTDKHTGVFNIAGTDYMNRVQLSLRILSYFPKASYDLQALSTEKLNQAAARPLQGGLKSKKFLDLYPDFVFGTVDEYIQQLMLHNKHGESADI